MKTGFVLYFFHGLLNISIWTGNERKKQRVGGQVEACAVVRLRILAAIACKQAATSHFRKFFCTADISTVAYCILEAIRVQC